MSEVNELPQEKTHQHLFSVMDVPFTANGKSWQFAPPKLIIGIVVAFITLPDLPFLTGFQPG